MSKPARGGPGTNQYATKGVPSGEAKRTNTADLVHAAESAVPLFRDSLGFSRAVALAGEQLGIAEAAIVKDYWVIQALRAAAAANPDVLFKGGTSLSKAWQLIARFSEDIDLVLSDPNNEITRSKRSKMMKELIEAAQQALGAHPIVADSSGANNKSRHILWSEPVGGVDSPVDIPIVDGFRQAILFEIRFKNGVDPNEPRQITTLLGDFLQRSASIDEYPDLAAVEVTCLHPGRTAIEKLTILSDAAATNLQAHADRHARHYYDVYMLLGDPRVTDLLSDRDYFTRTVEDHLAYSAEAHGQHNLHRPKDGFHRLWVFTDPSVDAVMSKAIDDVLESMYYGDRNYRPTWALIRERVRDVGGQHLL